MFVLLFTKLSTQGSRTYKMTCMRAII